jgi:hypothetical protein
MTLWIRAQRLGFGRGGKVGGCKPQSLRHVGATGVPEEVPGEDLGHRVLGTNVSLIALVIYLLADLFLDAPVADRPEPQLVVLLLMVTLAGTGATLWVLRGLLVGHIELASTYLKGYLEEVTDGYRRRLRDNLEATKVLVGRGVELEDPAFC